VTICGDRDAADAHVQAGSRFCEGLATTKGSVQIGTLAVASESVGAEKAQEDLGLVHWMELGIVVALTAAEGDEEVASIGRLPITREP